MKFAMPIIFLLLLLTPGFCISQEIVYEKEIESTFLVGEFDRSSLQEGEFGKHFMNEYENYNPCNHTLQQLKKNIYETSIVIVLGTWCHDSQTQLGRFYKILDLLDYNTNTVTNICLDKDKLAGELDITDFNVEFVPTFIFYNELVETGRIVESPSITLEKDILQILTQ